MKVEWISKEVQESENREGEGPPKATHLRMVSSFAWLPVVGNGHNLMVVAVGWRHSVPSAGRDCNSEVPLGKRDLPGEIESCHNSGKKFSSDPPTGCISSEFFCA